MHGNVSVHQQSTVLSACNAVPSGSNSETTAAKHKNCPCRFSPDLLGRKQVDRAVSSRDSSAQSSLQRAFRHFFLALSLCSLSEHISVNLCCLRVNNSVVVQGLSGAKERGWKRVGMCPTAAVLPDRTHVATYVLEFP